MNSASMSNQLCDSQLQLQEASLRYLDQTEQLDTLKKTCLSYRESKENAVYSFIIKIDCAEITEVDAPLGNLVLHQPQEARKIFQEVCYVSLRCLKLLPSEVTCSQVLVNLKLSDLPQLKSYQLTTGELHSCKFESRFYKFVGTVCSISSPVKYSRCAKYRCPESRCYGAADNFYIRCHIEGAKEHQTVRRDFNCVYCGSILREDVTCRILGERVTVQMVEGDVFPLHQFWGTDCYLGRYRQSVTIVLRDEFLNLQLGGCYCVIGIPVKEFTGNSAVSVMIEANNVFKVALTMPKEPRHHLSQTLRQLLANRATSPWSFAVGLAYLFADGITPAGTYHRLKLCILLSLVDAASRSSKRDLQGFLDLMAVGVDSNLIQRLLIYGASFAPRAIIHNSSQPLLAPLYRDSDGSGCYIEGGSVLLAHQGVCMLGDIDSLKKDGKEKLQHVMENRAIHVDQSRTLSSSSAQQQTFLVECNLWGYACSPQHQDPVEVFSASEAKRSRRKSILECFPMVLVCDSSNPTTEEYAELSIVRRTLLGAMQDKDLLGDGNSVITPSEIKELLQVASETAVEFSAPAMQLLKGYFVASRRVRSSGVHSAPFPPAALQTLACMSRALTQLSQRNEVCVEDAAFAVLLYEEAVTARYGYSVLDVQPKPHFKDGNISEYLGPENDALMLNFLARLSRFCRSHVPDFNMYESED
ncbi:MCM domain-containing protein 2-like [Acanthaster planci]|uniref:MCM domain-containing protein 2-like n=1 Tax=Acanthaster planci TaxID=133434 RepID=A0A8B7XI93_ACAPL|nr:MCM domain-containing protein 2-like [Acanthaster planci]